METHMIGRALPASPRRPGLARALALIDAECGPCTPPGARFMLRAGACLDYGDTDAARVEVGRAIGQASRAMGLPRQRVRELVMAPQHRAARDAARSFPLS